jgi:hypothetical protein
MQFRVPREFVWLFYSHGRIVALDIIAVRTVPHNILHTLTK